MTLDASHPQEVSGMNFNQLFKGIMLRSGSARLAHLEFSFPGRKAALFKTALSPWDRATLGLPGVLVLVVRTRWSRLLVAEWMWTTPPL
jgi:hypothetical protein